MELPEQGLQEEQGCDADRDWQVAFCSGPLTLAGPVPEMILTQFLAQRTPPQTKGMYVHLVIALLVEESLNLLSLVSLQSIAVMVSVGGAPVSIPQLADLETS